MDFKKACLIVSEAILITLGVALIVISYWSLNETNGLFGSFVNGHFEFFSNKHVWLLRLTGILIFFVVGLVYIFRKKILQYVSGLEITDFLINPKNVLGLIFNFIRALKEGVKKEDKIHSYTLILLIFIAIAIRIFYLSQPMIADETNIIESRIYHSQGILGFIHLISGYYIPGDHMFQTFLSYLTYKVLGNEHNIWLVRIPALLAGILLVPASYMVIRTFYNKHSALLTSAIIAASSYNIFYSTVARGYSMICLFFFLILALGAYLKKENNLAGWHLFSILSAFGFYTIPTMLYPYGIIIAWLVLSIFFKDTPLKRSHLLKNLFVSIALTVLLTFVLYSPIIFFGTGLKSLYAYPILKPTSLGIFIKSTPIIFMEIWNIWNRHTPNIIIFLLIIGFFISLFFHNKLSVHRVNIALAASIWLIPLFLFQRVFPEARHLIFLFPLYIGLASSGLISIFRPLEKTIFINHTSAMYSILAIIFSTLLLVNQVQSKPLYLAKQKHFLNESGDYTDFLYIENSITYHQLAELYGMNLHPGLYPVPLPADLFGMELPPKNLNDFYNMPKIFIIFDSPLKNNFWITGLQKSRHINIRTLINNNLTSYLSKDSFRCHSLFLISNQSIPVLEVLLKENKVSVSDYTVPELIHRYKDATLYKISRTKNCSKNNAMEEKAASTVYNWNVFTQIYKYDKRRFPGDSGNDGLIGNAVEEQTVGTSAIGEMAAFDNMPFTPNNPVKIGNYQFWVYFGYDSTNTNKNVLVLCKTVDCRDGNKLTNDYIKLIEAIDTEVDGIPDAGLGQFRASTKVVLAPDSLSVLNNHSVTAVVTEVTSIDETSAGSSTTWAPSHNSAVWLFDSPY